jgi:hypothetical protein
MWQDVMYSSFADSLVETALYTTYYLQNVEDLSGGKSYIHYDKATVSFHEMARNSLAERMQGDWIFMMDCDHQTAPDILVRLLRLRKKYGCRVISGIYLYKHPPHSPVANFFNEEGRVVPLVDWDRSAEIMEIGCTGAGCLLIDKSVIREISEKYGCGPFTQFPGLSEDYSFFKRCKELGITCHLAPQVEAHHVIRTPLYVDGYRPVRDGLIQTTVKGG